MTQPTFEQTAAAKDALRAADTLHEDLKTVLDSLDYFQGEIAKMIAAIEAGGLRGDIQRRYVDVVVVAHSGVQTAAMALGTAHLAALNLTGR